jgi:transposase
LRQTKQNKTSLLSEIDLQPGHAIVPTSGLGTNYVIFRKMLKYSHTHQKKKKKKKKPTFLPKQNKKKTIQNFVNQK